MKRQRDCYDAAACFILKGWAKMKWDEKYRLRFKKTKNGQTDLNVIVRQDTQNGCRQSKFEAGSSKKARSEREDGN